MISCSHSHPEHVHPLLPVWYLGSRVPSLILTNGMKIAPVNFLSIFTFYCFSRVVLALANKHKMKTHQVATGER